MNKVNYPLVIIIIAIAITIAIVAFLSFRSPEEVEQVTPQTSQLQENSKAIQPPESNLPASDSLEPLPSDSKKAVDNEISAIDSEINSLTDENIDDLAGIENEL